MIGSSRKSCPIRQLSLENVAAELASVRRKNLKKQFSEDVLESKNKWISATKKSFKALDRPPLAKEAWIDNKHQEFIDPIYNNRTEEGIVARRCKEIKRPATTKITRQSSLKRDSILLSHQELAERLRQAWKDREKGKQNLNIFLAHNVKEKHDDEFGNEFTDSECAFSNDNPFDKLVNKPKIILPLKAELTAGNEVNYKNIFQKRMRRAYSMEESLRNVAPTRALDAKSRNVVVVPLVDTLKLKDTNAKNETDKKNIIENKETAVREDEKTINVIIRPMTAATKRENFRNRSNSAFHTNLISEMEKPPLIRASSVPLKNGPSKPKFTPVKRKIKSATKKKPKCEMNTSSLINIYDVGNEKATNKDAEKDGNKKVSRCIATSGAEIITMVSLVSPDESEVEEVVDVDQDKPTAKIASPVKNVAATDKAAEKLEPQKVFTLRKAVKSVSFQQSSIHAVRSFSASFPARRASLAAALISHNSIGKTMSNSHEKRSTAETISNDDVREPKRRLVRMKSAPNERSIDEEKGDDISKSNEHPISKNALPDEGPQPKSETVEETIPKPNLESNNPTQPLLDTPKEKQCWEMYRKMNDKGVTISFDTILRGMLTPTEYRLRSKSIVSIESIDEN